MKVISSKEYLKKISDVKSKLKTEKLSKYNDFKEKFTKEFNKAAEEAILLLKDEFEIEYVCKKNMEPYINMFCDEIKDDYEKIEMFYDDDDENSEGPKSSKKNNDYLGSFVVVFSVIEDEDEYKMK